MQGMAMDQHGHIYQIARWVCSLTETGSSARAGDRGAGGGVRLSSSVQPLSTDHTRPASHLAIQYAQAVEVFMCTGYLPSHRGRVCVRVYLEVFKVVLRVQGNKVIFCLESLYLVSYSQAPRDRRPATPKRTLGV